MKIAIHHRKNSFSDQWVEYCRQNGIDYKLVNAYESDIAEQVRDCNAFMWHHNHTTYQDKLAAKNILSALEHSGLKVFPNFYTGWHFDDKVAQKYLLESINAPVVPSHIFYDKKAALQWIADTAFPIVFKLRGGSGAKNVKLVRNRKQGVKLIKKAFSKGFAQFDRFEHLKERYRKFRIGKDTFLGVMKGVYRIFVPTIFSKMKDREKGYVYFQDFMPNNNFDIRLIVIGNRAYGMKRKVREGDFRASGSGDFSYERIPDEVLEIGFNVADRLKLQTVAFDFIYNMDSQPVIVEISYGFGTKGSSKCPGYWNRDLSWQEGKFDPQSWMIEDLVDDINK